MPRYASTDDLLSATTHEPHTSDWVVVDQARIDAFADATDDHQWIHSDTERAATGPFGGPIAHGFLTLSLLPRLLVGAIEVDGVAMRINYGLDSVRFTNVVPAGSRVRAVSRVVSAERGGTGIRVGVDIVVEIEGVDKPAIRAQQILLIIEDAA